jgi:hypothetical protein|tara:strand:+ start:2850 stop:3515 length:666 start_codon:yes stop_codon:yes gene_type:complete
MKKLFIPLIIFIISFDLKAQRDYTVENIEEYISNQKTFAVIPFTFKITAEKPRKMAQSDFDASVYDAEKNGATAAQQALINRVLRKKNRVAVEPQPQARTNTLLKRNGEIRYTDGVWGSFDAYLPEELCEMLGVDAVIIGTVSSGKIFTTAGSVVMKFLKLGGSPSVSADLSLFDKDGTMIWQWSSDSMKASGMGSSVDDMMEYIFKKGARKMPYTGLVLK